MPIKRGEGEREHRQALLIDLRDAQLAETRPGGRRTTRDRKPRVSGPHTSLGRMIQQCAKRPLPARAERGYKQRTLQVLTPMSWQIEQSIDFGDGHVPGSVGDLDDFIACAYQAF